MSNIQNDKHYSKYLSYGKFKMSTIFVLEIKGSKNDKIFNFLNGRFTVMGGPMDTILGVFLKTFEAFEAFCIVLNYNFAIFLKI